MASLAQLTTLTSSSQLNENSTTSRLLISTSSSAGSCAKDPLPKERGGRVEVAAALAAPDVYKGVRHLSLLPSSQSVAVVDLRVCPLACAA